MARFGTINRDCLGIEQGEFGREFDLERVEILKYLVRQRWEELGDTAFRDSVSAGWPGDDLKVFVKQEPHKISKLEEGRLRLICAVSLVDTMVDRILFGPMWRNALLSVGKTPVMAGWSPLRGGWRHIRRKLGKDGFSVDRTAWDWTVTEWQVYAWLYIVQQLHPGAPEWWVTRVKARWFVLFHAAVFRFSDGTRVKQSGIGIMKSGCLLTLALNSVGQLLIHALACFDLDISPWNNVPLCMGDDTIQKPFPEMFDYVDSLNKFCLVKEAEYTEGYLEFIGFLFTEKGFVPAYWQKHLYQLRHMDTKVERETLINFQVLWAYDPVMLSLIREMIFSIDPTLVLTEQMLSSIVDSS